jgi:UDPglucose 6-dehydrogenase
LFIIKIVNHFNGNVTGKHFAVWGLAFKPNTDDIREAPSIKIINGLLKKGALISAYDPEAKETTKSVLGDKIEYAESSYKSLENADALIIVTEWNEFRTPDFNKIKSLLKEPVIFDGRNLYDPDKMKENDFIYYSVGRVPVK